MRKFKIFLPILVVLLVVAASLIPPSRSKYVGRTLNYTMRVVSEIEETYFHNGGEQTFTVPVSGYYYISAWGGDGGKGGEGTPNSNQSAGGRSQKVSGTYKFNAGDELYIYVGSAGESKPLGNVPGSGTGADGGTNGSPGSLGYGGKGGTGYKYLGQYSGAGGGGGAGTFVLKNSQTVSEYTALVCSGGGGGSGGGNSALTVTSAGGTGGDGGSSPTYPDTVVDGSPGAAGENSGGAGGSGNNGSNSSGSIGHNGETKSANPPGGGGGGGGGGFNFGGGGGVGGPAGFLSNTKGGGGGGGGQSYINGTDTSSSYDILNHSRPTTSDGAVIISFLGP